MNGENICVVLCHPDESRNVGSVCRAMANNDVHELRIVGCKADYDEEKVKTLSIHAFYIWENAKFYETLQDAVQDCVIAAGTTRRRGKKRKDFLCLPEEFCSIAQNVTDGKIALIFGNERTGLTDEELEVCTLGINIPSSDDFGSLNLSHAVQVMLYVLFRKFSNKSAGYTPIDMARLEKTVNCISSNLEKIGFFKLAGKTDMENFWRGILSRAVLSEGEAKYIEKVFTKASGLASKACSSERNAAGGRSEQDGVNSRS